MSTSERPGAIGRRGGEPPLFEPLEGRIVPSTSSREFPIFAAVSAPLQLVNGFDGDLWFTSGHPYVRPEDKPPVDQLGEISPSGVVRLIPLPANSAAGAIAEGPDGAMWMPLQTYTSSSTAFGSLSTDYSGPASILRIDPSGTETEYPLPATVYDVSQSGSLISGPGGDLWFGFGDVIDRITTAGVVTSFSPFGANSPTDLFVSSMVAGADGNVWFSAGTSVGRMTPSGDVTFFPVPATGATLYGLTVGPDGNVWFAATNGLTLASEIGEITPSGSVTLHPLPTGLDAFSLTAYAGDDDLWFIAAQLPDDTVIPPPPVLGRITTSGAITIEPSDAFKPAPEGAPVYGPGGNLWYSVYGESAVAELVLSTPAVSHVAQRVTPHASGADVDLTFDSDLDPSTADDATDYVIERLAVRKGKVVVTRKIAPTSAVYDAATDTVDLHVKTRLVSSPRRPYVVVVDGSLASPEGQRLTGVSTIGPGSNAVVKVPRAIRFDEHI